MIRLNVVTSITALDCYGQRWMYFDLAGKGGRTFPICAHCSKPALDGWKQLDVEVNYNVCENCAIYNVKAAA